MSNRLSHNRPTAGALTGSTIRNACLAGVSIADAGYQGMRIEGILVTELLRVYRETHGTWSDGPSGQSD
jgi:hypothetical protein